MPQRYTANHFTTAKAGIIPVEGPDITSDMTGNGINVCIVEDDTELRQLFTYALTHAGFTVRAFPGSRELYAELLREPTELLLLDLGLPGEDGHAIMRRLRNTMSIDIGIVICSARNTVDERIRSMMTGADAYLVKPVDLRELVATLLTVHRRVRKAVTNVPNTTTWSLIDNGWSLRCPDGESLALTASESSVLKLLFETPGKPVPREVMIAALGHSSDYYLDHRLDMVFTRLRRKVREGCTARLPLRAVRGVGFILSP
ncbi:MAG: response regulator transcription factor [Alcanivorax sp.]|nr:response regulator transcription factor [Alcanivorax sp.]